MQTDENVAELSYAPKEISFAKNAKLTAVLFTLFALLGAALWGIEQMTAGK